MADEIDENSEVNNSEDQKPQKKVAKHDSGAVDLEKVTDYAEETEISTQDLFVAMSLIGDKHSKEAALKAARQKELAKVTIKKEDVELIMQEMEISPNVAEVVLPTAPKAARGPDFDLSRVPTNPPFTAFLGNLPYDVSEDDISLFFRQLQVTNVRLPRDNEGKNKKRKKGFGYAEFADRQNLIQALSLNSENLKNRAIKVLLAADHDNERKDRRNDGGVDRTLGDWRVDRKDPPPQSEDFSRSGGMNRSGGGGGRYEQRREGGGYGRDSGRDGPDRDREYQPRSTDERRPPPEGSSPDEGPKERRKLQLAPRTKPIEAAAPPPSEAAKSSIFGAAKPVDTAAKEKEIEARLAREKDSTVVRDASQM